MVQQQTADQVELGERGDDLFASYRGAGAVVQWAKLLLRH